MIIIINIGFLIGAGSKLNCALVGKDLQNLPISKNAWLLIKDGCVIGFGSMAEVPNIEKNTRIINASGKSVLPCWCDSHTHSVYAEDREGEFVDRINGLSYQEIAGRGGGIINSAASLNALSEDELFKLTLERVNNLVKKGTGALEIKSGYGLSVKGELKMLRVIKRIAEKCSFPIRSTFLGAHAYPTEYRNNKEGYINLIIKEMLPAIKEEKLADFIDVFCESGYFSVKDTSRILDAGVSCGLTPKVHVNQFNSIGGVLACVKAGALTVDHLEVISDDDIIALSDSKTICTALPSCSFFLNIPYTPVQRLLNADIPVALASDYNPGSSPSGNMNFVLSLACIKMKMTPEQAINTMTVNGAMAMGVGDIAGRIAIGNPANIIITKPIKSVGYLPYSFGDDLIDDVWIQGKSVT